MSILDENAAISGFMDNHPNFFLQAQTWLTSLSSLSVKADVFLHIAPSVPLAIEESFTGMEVNVVRVPTELLGLNGYCNKISQLESGALYGYDKVILSDLDVFYLENPFEFSDFSKVAAKVVDLPNPPTEIFEKIINAAKLDCDSYKEPTLKGGLARTLPCNFNGGLYLIPGKQVEIFNQNWRKWAEFCNEHSNLLLDYKLHIDQISFALTILEHEVPYELLDVYHNFPTHLSSNLRLDGAFIYDRIPSKAIKMLHYHGRYNDSGFLLETGVAWIDEFIKYANSVLLDQNFAKF